MRFARSGFTLIEILVVVAIVGVLSAVVLSALNDARAKSNDARRLADLKQVQKALELYYDDYGHYPIRSGWMGTTPGCYGNPGDPNAAIPGLVPTYLPSMPQDPKLTANPNNCYLYTSSSDGSGYKFLIYGTVQTMSPAPGEPNARYRAGCGVAQASFAVYTEAFSCT